MSLKTALQRHIKLSLAYNKAQISKTCDPAICDAAGYDPVKMTEVWVYIDGETVLADPS